MLPAKSLGRIDVHQRVRSGLSDQTIVAWAQAARRRLPPRRGSVSIVIVGPARSRQINRQYRRKDKPTNVLSFTFDALPSSAPVEPVWGEIILCPTVIKREAREQERTYREYFRFLLQHGLIHLLGLDHQTPTELQTWQKLERRLLV